MAAKSVRGSSTHKFTTEGKPYFFDISTVDEMMVCYSCHAGGGPAEGIVNKDGTVTPYNSPTLKPVHSYDRDFYTYSSDNVTYAILSGIIDNASIDETIKKIGAPFKHDWNKSGVMENDCLLCHIDPDYSTNKYVYKAGDGLYVQPFRPRMMIFAERDSNGKVVKISLGMPLSYGIKNQTVLPYTDSLNRMTRPISKEYFMLTQLPKEDIKALFNIWVGGLEKLWKNGAKDLPYALYAPPSIVPDIYTNTGISDNYTYNPKGGSDEMARLQKYQEDIGKIFTDILNYLKDKGYVPDNATMDTLYKMFFNKFVYGYEILDPGTGQLLPIPYPLRKYDFGNFYTDWDSPDASVRDYVRAPLVEGEGIPYSGLVGIGMAAFYYAYQDIMKNGTNSPYYDENSFFNVNLAKVFEDMNSNPELFNKLANMVGMPGISANHTYLNPLFYAMPSANLMGLDLNHDGKPLIYIQLVKGNDGKFTAEVYYEKGDLDQYDGSIPGDVIFGGKDNINSWKWIKICGQCHVMTKDDGNSEWTRGRLYNLGMPADWVKNGQYVNFTDNPEAPGYDVHMSNKKMGCATCHIRTDTSDLEKIHDFLKGTDTAHMVRNDLDNNPKPKTCEYCHLEGGDPDAPNPTKIHEEKFGSSTEKHMETIECEVCHVPYKRTWRFRTFDDTLGYYANFDNRFGYYILMYPMMKSDFPAMAFPPYYALSPVYGTSPGYGIPHFHMVSQHIDSDGSGNVQPMDYVSQMVDYFWFNSESDPELLPNGFMTNPKFDFWKAFYDLSLDRAKELGLPLSYNKDYDNEVYPPLYYANGRNGYPQITIGNPITIVTWVDANPISKNAVPGDNEYEAMKELPYNGAKVLYLREINAAIEKFIPVAHFYKYTPKQLENIPPQGCKDDPDIGKVIIKPTALYPNGYVVCDHTGDGFPDLWWPEDVKAMQAALTEVLKAEGEKDPKPLLFIAAHYFSDSHGVLPKEKALGAKSCYDCHGDYKKDPGAHRITDRIITYVPWAPAWFQDKYRALKYDEETGKMVPTGSTDPLFIVDGEVAYIKKITADGISFLGAEEKDILSLSKKHAEELFYMVGSKIDNVSENLEKLIGLSEDKIKESGADGTYYVREVEKNVYVFVPQEIADNLTELEVKNGMIKVGAEELTKFDKPIIANVPITENSQIEAASIIPISVSSTTDGYKILDNTKNGYITVAVYQPGTYTFSTNNNPAPTPLTGYSSGGGGGGCMLNPNAPFDPTLLILAGLMFGLFMVRRKKRS